MLLEIFVRVLYKYNFSHAFQCCRVENEEISFDARRLLLILAPGIMDRASRIRSSRQSLLAEDLRDPRLARLSHPGSFISPEG